MDIINISKETPSSVFVALSCIIFLAVYFSFGFLKKIIKNKREIKENEKRIYEEELASRSFKKESKRFFDREKNLSKWN